MCKNKNNLSQKIGLKHFSRKKLTITLTSYYLVAIIIFNGFYIQKINQYKLTLQKLIQFEIAWKSCKKGLVAMIFFYLVRPTMNDFTRKRNKQTTKS